MAGAAGLFAVAAVAQGRRARTWPPLLPARSVPTGDETRIVTQYFLRDPDGYYCELCNCEVLTDFCL